jgi:hypothetical protein
VVGCDDDVADVVERMLQTGVRSVPVLDGRNSSGSSPAETCSVPSLVGSWLPQKTGARATTVTFDGDRPIQAVRGTRARRGSLERTDRATKPLQHLGRGRGGEVQGPTIAG